MTPSEEYWNRRALAETRAALGCDDARIAALHVDIATRCVRQVLLERERSEGKLADAVVGTAPEPIQRIR